MLVASTCSTGGFKMFQLKDFFDIIQFSWIRWYVNGLDNHWADMLDENLNLNIKNRAILLTLGSENPKVNKVIHLELPGLSRFFISFKRIIESFYWNKSAEDNRWINFPIFYNPNFQRKEFGEKAKILKSLLTPADIGL